MRTRPAGCSGSGPRALRNRVTCACRRSRVSSPIEFSNVGRPETRHLAAVVGHRLARASAEKTTAAAREPVSARRGARQAEGVAERRADDLVDAARAGIRAKVDLGDVGRVHVAAEDGDRGRRLAAAAELTSRRSSMRWMERAWNAAQCSRSTARRSRSPETRRARAPAPSQTASFHASRWWMPVWHEDRQRRRDDQVVEGAAGVLGDPVPFLLVDHVAAPLDEDAGGARVDHQQPRVGRSRGSRPTGSPPTRDPTAGCELAQRGPCVVVRLTSARASPPPARAARGSRCAGRASTT